MARSLLGRAPRRKNPLERMANNYGLPQGDLDGIRARDASCVYCHREMNGHSRVRGTPNDKATIEHLNNDGPFDMASNVVICCGLCNRMRGNKKLLDWFKTPYCIERHINRDTVTEPVREYIRCIEEFADRCTWTFAKTMPEIPHEYVVRDRLSESDTAAFDAMNGYIAEHGYTATFGTRSYTYLNSGRYKYWIIDNILNREKLV
jgi:hypothetical protein